jgi:hypothetical protein
MHGCCLLVMPRLLYANRDLDASLRELSPIPPLLVISPHDTHTMALLVDKHRPRNLDALNYHPELSERLRALVSEANPPCRV